MMVDFQNCQTPLSLFRGVSGNARFGEFLFFQPIHCTYEKVAGGVVLAGSIGANLAYVAALWVWTILLAIEPKFILNFGLG